MRRVPCPLVNLFVAFSETRGVRRNFCCARHPTRVAIAIRQFGLTRHSRLPSPRRIVDEGLFPMISRYDTRCVALRGGRDAAVASEGGFALGDGGVPRHLPGGAERRVRGARTGPARRGGRRGGRRGLLRRQRRSRRLALETRAGGRARGAVDVPDRHLPRARRGGGRGGAPRGRRARQQRRARVRAGARGGG